MALFTEGVPFRQGGPPRTAVNPAQLLRHLLELNARAQSQTGIPSMFGIDDKGRLFLTPNFVDHVGYRAQINLANMIMKTVAASQDQTVNSMRLLAEAILVEQADGVHIERANKVLAIEMRKALIAGYGQSVEKRKQVPSYPRQNRLSGALRRAIEQPDMAVGTAGGINYINQDRLNVEARHWARINFGVQPAPGARRGRAQSKAPTQYEILSPGEGRVGAGSIGFKARPRPPMYLPPGFWEFIGGRATGREVRRSRPALEGDDDREQVQSAAAARRQARMAARLGKSSPPPSTGGSRDDSKYISSTYRVSLARRLSGTSKWGRDYGPYTKKRTYNNKYRVGGRNPFDPSAPQSYRKKQVTAITRGIRRSRQAFHPLGGTERYPTAGVVASNFMDQGFRALAAHADRVYAGMANNIIDESASQAQRKAYRKLQIKYDAKMEINALLNSARNVTRSD